MSKPSNISRREALSRGSNVLAALAFFDSPLFAWAQEGERTIPWVDQPPPPPKEIAEQMGTDMNLLDWQSLDSWITPNRKFFRASHYRTPVLNAENWKLEIGGLVDKRRLYSLNEIKALPKKDVIFAMECSGNSGFPWFEGGVGNARWSGTPLAPVLERAGLKKGAIEVVLFGSDGGDETIPYIEGGGEKLADIKMKLEFARSMSVTDALNPANLLCYEMNGEPLPPHNGFPVRLIAPGWYGIANVKWLKRIELRDTRFMGPYMAERYVTIREEPGRNGEVHWTRMSVSRSHVKSIPARVTLKNGRYTVRGAAWGAPITRVEVRFDQGPWTVATIDQGQQYEFAWKFWDIDWKSPSPGLHMITCRAIDRDGNVQPAPSDWQIAKKRTYWESNGQITRTVRI
jgi:DMSO/TMAO reductase YedYZ molybdopterin-dependent catalytic subunit